MMETTSIHRSLLYGPQKNIFKEDNFESPLLIPLKNGAVPHSRQVSISPKLQSSSLLTHGWTLDEQQQQQEQIIEEPFNNSASPLKKKEGNNTSSSSTTTTMVYNNRETSKNVLEAGSYYDVQRAILDALLVEPINPVVDTSSAIFTREELDSLLIDPTDYSRKSPIVDLFNRSSNWDTPLFSPQPINEPAIGYGPNDTPIIEPIKFHTNNTKEWKLDGNHYNNNVEPINNHTKNLKLATASAATINNNTNNSGTTTTTTTTNHTLSNNKNLILNDDDVLQNSVVMATIHESNNNNNNIITKATIGKNPQHLHDEEFSTVSAGGETTTEHSVYEDDIVSESGIKRLREEGCSVTSSSNHLFPRPRGRGPKGKIWDVDHGGWVTPVKIISGFNRPRGRAPSNKYWDSETGTWRDWNENFSSMNMENYSNDNNNQQEQQFFQEYHNDDSQNMDISSSDDTILQQQQQQQEPTEQEQNNNNELSLNNNNNSITSDDILTGDGENQHEEEEGLILM